MFSSQGNIAATPASSAWKLWDILLQVNIEPSASDSENIPIGVLVVNWNEDAIELIQALASASSAQSLCVTCMGTTPATQVEPIFKNLRAPNVRFDYVQGSAASDPNSFVASLSTSIDLKTIDSVVILPNRATSEVDAFSRLTCVTIKQAFEQHSKWIPAITVAVDDPDSAPEFSDLGVASIFYPGLLRAALLAQASIDITAFHILYGLLVGVYRLQLVKLPQEMSHLSFAEACIQLLESQKPDQDPTTPIGICLSQPQPNSQHLVEINPDPNFPLSNAIALISLA